ncbi:MAG: hypothetical protein H8D23_27990 [Candidatus Brocadiales bacterium]|nr:hypothetical protein [Candidatus Brocadiales bacterium]
MPLVECHKCGYSIKVEDSSKKYKHPLFFIFLGLVILVFERNLNSPGLIITILGTLSATSGLIWLVVTRSLSRNKLTKQ